MTLALTPAAAKRVLFGAAVALFVTMIPSGCSLRQRQSAGEPAVETAVVRRGELDVTIPVTGQLDAAGGTTVVSQYGRDGSWGGKLRWVAEDGKPIQKGDLLMELAVPETEQYVHQLELDLETKRDATRQAKVTKDREVQNAKAALRKAEERLALAQAEAEAGEKKDDAALRFAQEQLEFAKAELAKSERLAAARLAPRSKVEEAADKVAEKQFEVEKAKSEQDANGSKRALEAKARQLEIDKAKVELANAILGRDLAVANARVEERSVEREWEEAKEVLARAKIFAPDSGILMVEQNWDQGLRLLRPGDTVWHNMRVARIVSFEKMIARCQFGELDMARVKKGQQARVRVISLPDYTFRGRVRVVENLATEGSPWEGEPAGRKICRAIVEVLGSHARLRPGMTVMAEIVLAQAHGLCVPVECVFETSSQAVVYRREGRRFRAIPVKVEERSDLLAAIAGDLKEGDQVARKRPPRRLIVADAKTKE